MIILDTNVLSAVMQQGSNRVVAEWLGRQRISDLWTTTITIFELQFALELLPAGRRRSQLEAEMESLLDKLVYSRILTFDADAAKESAILAAERQAIGKKIDTSDTMIAGIALAHRAVIATRNVRHFSDLDVKVVNPWED